jgi:hypothetical protein
MISSWWSNHGTLKSNRLNRLAWQLKYPVDVAIIPDQLAFEIDLVLVLGHHVTLIATKIVNLGIGLH